MHSTNMVTADEIRKVRQSREESQEVFGAHFGVDQSTIHRWETGGVPQRGATAVGIEKILFELRNATDAPQQETAAW